MTISAEGVPLRERQRQEREALILKAAADLFVERGYHDTSMEDIAARVGIAKGTVYLHFASKEDLALALVDQGVRRFARALDTILESGGTPRARLEAIIERTHAAMADGMAQAFEAIFRNPEIVTRMRERHDEMSALWREPMRKLSAMLDEGKALGEFDTTIPTPILLNLLMSLIAWRHGQGQLTVDLPPAEVSRHIRRFFFKGIAPERPERPGEHAPPGMNPSLAR